IENEFRAQIKRCIDSDLKLGFLNSHQHLHLLPRITKIVIRLAKEFQIPYIRVVNEPSSDGMNQMIRRWQLWFLHLLSSSATRKIRRAGLQCNDVFIGFLNAGNLQESDLKSAVAIANSNPKITVELGCHPGFSDETVAKKYESWRYYWEEEMKTLQK